jgi:hypothetical protein
MKRPATYPQGEVWGFIVTVFVGEGESSALNGIHYSIYDSYTQTYLSDVCLESTINGLITRQYLFYQYAEENNYAFLQRAILWLHSLHLNISDFLDTTEISPEIDIFIPPYCTHTPTINTAITKFNAFWQSIAQQQSKKRKNQNTKNQRRKAQQQATAQTRAQLEQLFQHPDQDSPQS